MKCTKCDGDTKVTDLVHNSSSNEVYRRRKCINCGNVFYTTEFEVERNEQFKKEWNKHHRCSVRKGE